MEPNTKKAIDLITDERKRMELHGWDEIQINSNTHNELANAAAYYAMTNQVGKRVDAWPWESVAPESKPRIDELATAGAFIVAEIERLTKENESYKKQKLEKLTSLVGLPVQHKGSGCLGTVSALDPNTETIYVSYMEGIIKYSPESFKSDYVWADGAQIDI